MSTAVSFKHERLAAGSTSPTCCNLRLAGACAAPPLQLDPRAPLLWHGDALWAVGDWLLAPPLRSWLDARGARYAWTV
jgi:hypothetical protein